MTATAQPIGGQVERTIAILERLALAEEPVRLSDLAAATGAPKSAVHRILASLIERGWVDRGREDDRYELSLQMPLLGQQHLARMQAGDLRQPILDALGRKTRELVRLTAIRGDRLVWIGSARGRRTGLVYEPDMTERIVPFATANGKVWLADLESEAALRIAFDAGLGRPDVAGPRALTTVEQLLAELERTRERGYGLAREEAELGVSAIAVPVRRGDALVGTMSVAAPVARLDLSTVEAVLPELRLAAARMTLAWQ